MKNKFNKKKNNVIKILKYISLYFIHFLNKRYIYNLYIIIITIKNK